MQKTIAGKTYDTENATLVSTRAYGAYGDPHGYEERLYQTPEGNYFLYGSGGEESPYAVEKIIRFAKKRAEEWLTNT